MAYYAYYGDDNYDVTDEDIKLFEEWRERNGYGACLGFADENAEGSFDLTDCPKVLCSLPPKTRLSKASFPP